MLEPCSRQNFQQWIGLRKALYQDVDQRQLAQEAERFLCEPDRYCQYLVRSDTGEAIGFAEGSVRHDFVNGTSGSPVVYLESIYVRAEHRRTGVAKRLFEVIVTWARELGIEEIASDADLSNTASQALHQALGFVETERVVFFKKNTRV